MRDASTCPLGMHCAVVGSLLSPKTSVSLRVLSKLKKKRDKKKEKNFKQKSPNRTEEPPHELAPAGLALSVQIPLTRMKEQHVL